MSGFKRVAFSMIFLSLFFSILTGCADTDDTAGKAEDPLAQTADLAEVEDDLVPGTVYGIKQLLYFSGGDIDVADPTKYYRISEDGGIDIVDAATGDVVESHGGEAVYEAVDEEEWSGLFTGGLSVDISGYEKKTQYTISDSYRLFFMDDEIWLGTYNDSGLTSLSELRLISAPEDE